MPPITKENETLDVTTESPARSGSVSAGSDAGAKQQPVALEVSVTVNGARSIEGSDKREPFSETTKTVLVFGNGAVIRLTSSVAPGQLLFLTNERTKKEVVCQVVKSKNYRNVSGYVELEFTEPVVGFWGMRFPSDRLSPAAPPAPTVMSGAGASPQPVTAGIEQPAANTTASVVAAKPTPVAPSVPASSLPSASPSSSIVPPPMDSATLLGANKPVRAETPVGAPVAPLAPNASMPAESASSASMTPTAPVFEIASRSDEAASILAPSPAADAVPTVDLSSLAPFFEVKPAAPAGAPGPAATPVPANSETETLKQQTARLQEQLSHMFFEESKGKSATKPVPKTSAEPAAPIAPVAPVAEKKELQEGIGKVLEMAKAPAPKTQPVPAVAAEPVKLVSESKLAKLEEEELKIPAWLEPLARNASAPSSTQELILREKAKRLAEQPQMEEIAAEPAAPETFTGETEITEPVSEVRAPEFGSTLAIDGEDAVVETQPEGSSKSLLFGAIAAGVLLVAGGAWWYWNQQPAANHVGAAAAQPPAVSNSANNLPAKPQVEAAAAPNTANPLNALPQPVNSTTHPAPAPGTAVSESKSVASVTAPETAPSSLAVVSARSLQANGNRDANHGNGGAAATGTRAVQPEAEPAVEKKVVLGQIHLAAPSVKQNRNVPNGVEPDEAIVMSEAQPVDNTDSLGAGLVVGGKQPAAPAAPLPVGGDVKQAKLISSVAPVYPPLAKNQHVSGNVTIDALIDATGRVTTMKVVSGPTLLHQAAMDALKQWKYQPAQLDGKPVPMHLTVTLQFRLQ